MNPDTIGYVWTGEFDLNTLRVDEEIFESGKKKLRIQKYPDTCGQDLSYNLTRNNTVVVVYFAKKSVTSCLRQVRPLNFRSTKFCQTQSLPNFKDAVVLPRSRTNFCQA